MQRNPLATDEQSTTCSYPLTHARNVFESLQAMPWPKSAEICSFDFHVQLGPEPAQYAVSLSALHVKPTFVQLGWGMLYFILPAWSI